MDSPTIPPKPTVVMPPPEATFIPQASVVAPLPPSPKGTGMNKKVLGGIIGVLILTITTIAGFVAIAKPVIFKSSASNCGLYTFGFSTAGIVSVRNASTENEPLQRARVYVNNVLVQTFDVPALNAGASATLGTVNVPTSGFDWRVEGTSSCINSGHIDVAVAYQCQNIKVFTEDGLTELTSSQIDALSAGTTIRLVAKGTGLASNYTAVKFTINGVEQGEATTKMSSGDLYLEYKIPETILNFAITAKLKSIDGIYR